MITLSAARTLLPFALLKFTSVVLQASNQICLFCNANKYFFLSLNVVLSYDTISLIFTATKLKKFVLLLHILISSRVKWEKTELLFPCTVLSLVTFQMVSKLIYIIHFSWLFLFVFFFFNCLVYVIRHRVRAVMTKILKKRNFAINCSIYKNRKSWNTIVSHGFVIFVTHLAETHLCWHPPAAKQPKSKAPTTGLLVWSYFLVIQARLSDSETCISSSLATSSSLRTLNKDNMSLHFYWHLSINFSLKDLNPTFSPVDCVCF